MNQAVTLMVHSSLPLETHALGDLLLEGHLKASRKKKGTIVQSDDAGDASCTLLSTKGGKKKRVPSFPSSPKARQLHSDRRNLLKGGSDSLNIGERLNTSGDKGWHAV